MSIAFKKTSTIEETVHLLGRYQSDAVIVNGGTDIVLDIAEKKIVPKIIIFIADIPELKIIRLENGEVVLGGAVTYSQMEENPITNRIAGLMKSLYRLGSPTIRKIATPAGNIGRAATSADCSTILTALQATVVLKSDEGERRIPIDKVFTGISQNAILPNELITEIRFPDICLHQGTGYCKVSRRKMQDIGKILVGAVIEINNGKCSDASVSLGALNATIVRSKDIENRLIGKTKEEAHEAIMSNLPQEVGFRSSYYKNYKELTTAWAVDEAVMQAWKEAECKL